MHVVKIDLVARIRLTGAFPPRHVRREKDLKAADEEYATNREPPSTGSGGSRTWEEQERKRGSDRFT